MIFRWLRYDWKKPLPAQRRFANRASISLIVNRRSLGAPVVELVDALHSKCSSARSARSSRARGTITDTVR